MPGLKRTLLDVEPLHAGCSSRGLAQQTWRGLDPSCSQYGWSMPGLGCGPWSSGARPMWNMPQRVQSYATSFTPAVSDLNAATRCAVSLVGYAFFRAHTQAVGARS